MDTFIKVTAGALVSLILYLILSKRDKDMALLLSLAVCCFVAAAAFSFLEPVLHFVRQLQELGQLDTQLLQILLKTVGVGLLAEIASLVCSDAGNASLGKLLQILAIAVILWLSLPMLSGILELVEEILGDL